MQVIASRTFKCLQPIPLKEATAIIFLHNLWETFKRGEFISQAENLNLKTFSIQDKIHKNALINRLVHK